jgi:small conductance mechanosensitive channel
MASFPTSLLRNPLHLLRILAVALAFLLPAAPHAQAQSAPAAKPADIENLIKTLDDDAARAKLKQQLELMLKAQRGDKGAAQDGNAPAELGIGARMLAAISKHVESVSNALVNLVEAIADLPQRIRQAGDVLADPQERAYWLDVVVDTVAVLAAAFAAAWAGRRIVRRPLQRIGTRRQTRWLMRLLYLPLLAVLEALPGLAFVVVGYVVLTTLHPNADAREIVTALLAAQTATMATAAIFAALLAVRAPGLRLFRLTDESAVYLQVWVRRISVVAFFGYAVTELGGAIGLAPSLYEAISRAWGLLLAAMGVILMMQNRVAVARWIAGGPMEETPAEAAAPGDEHVATPLPEPESADVRTVRFRAFRRQAAKVWHVLAIAYITAGYAVWSFQIAGGFAFLLRATVLTAILFVVLRIADTFLRQIFDRSFALPDEIKRVLPGLETRTNRYLPILKQTLLVALYIAGVFALLQVWGLDTIGWLSEGSGRPVMAAVFKIIIVLLLSTVLSELADLAIEHYLRDTDQQGRRIYHSGRMRTLLPLLRNAFRITLGVLVLMVVLSEIGVDIAPLLAAAGVVGLAVGFGAQTLVKDIITGVFILIEDTIAIGDVVDLGGHAGVVEGMTIRTIRLRDAAGAVHTVPFSAVTIVQNMTKDFSYATFDIKIDYRADVDAVMTAMKEAGAAVEKDKALRFGVLGPLEIIGLDSFQDSGMVVKARMKTRAMSQWDVMRAFNLRLKRLFDEREIRFAGMMAAMPAAAPAKHEVTIEAATLAAAPSPDQGAKLLADAPPPAVNPVKPSNPA